MLEVDLRTGTRHFGSLYFDVDHLRRITSVIPRVIAFSNTRTSPRREAEELIESTYRDCHGSRITSHYSTLMSVQDDSGRVLAAVGFRSAAQQPLFVEQYLQDSIESRLSDAIGAFVPREKVVEIGNLASAGKGASAILFVALAAYLQQQKFTHAVVTATDQLRAMFQRFGFRWINLGAADPNALPECGESWGRYYERNPEILAGNIEACFENLERFVPQLHNNELKKIFSHIHNSFAEINQ